MRGMNDEQNGRIESELARCLKECVSTDRPHDRVLDLIAALKADPEWTESEIIELQSRIIWVLLYRPSGGQTVSLPAAGLV